MSISLRSLIAALGTAASVLLGSQVVNAQETYSFGVVPQFTANQIMSTWQPILTELEERTGYKFSLTGSPKIPDFEVSFSHGAFDFAYMNPYHFLLAANQQGYLPLVRDHGRQLFGILVVPKASDIQDISELHGKQIAYPAPNALGASLMMRAILEREHGVVAEPKYVSTHTNSYMAAAAGDTAAGGGVMGTLNRQSNGLRNALRVLYETPKVPPHPVAAHPRIPEEVREKVRQAFLDMAQTEEGQAMLAAVPFKQIGAATPSEYQVLKQYSLEDFYVSVR